MDRIEAMALLSEIKNYLTAGNPVWHKEVVAEALDIAIEALQNLSKPNNGLQGLDLISRQDIKYHVQLEAMGNGQYEEVEIAHRSDIESLPSADRPTGEWVSEDGTPSEASYSVYCSRCGQWSEYRGFFCLWCGARMGGGPND